MRNSTQLLDQNGGAGAVIINAPLSSMRLKKIMAPWGCNFVFGGFRMGVRHKFNARPVVIDGKRWDSTLEYQYMLHLELLKKCGKVLYYHDHVNIRLTGGTKYEVDFLVFYTDGSVKYIDVKGMETNVFKIKKREVEAIYPFQIEIVRKGDF